MVISLPILILVVVLTLTISFEFLNLVIWRVQIQDQPSLWLVAWLMASAIFVFCRLLQYAPLSDRMYVLVPRILLTAGYSLAWVGYEFSNAFISFRPRRWERALIISLVGLIILLLWTSNLILTDQVITRVVTFGGAFHGVESGVLYLPASILILGVGAVPPCRLIRAQVPYKRESCLMAVGFVFVILFSLSDFVAIGLDLVWIRLSDYSYLPVAIFFSIIQVQRFGQLYRGMEVMVRERTAELRQTNETLRAEINDRKQDEKYIKEREDQYRRLVEHSPYGIVIHIQGKLAYANPTAVRLIGAKNLEEVLGRSIMDFVHPDSRPAVLQRLGEMVEGKEVPLLQEKFVCLDGSVIDVEVVGYPLTYQNQPAVQVVFQDITERKQIEGEIRRQADEMTLLYETTHDLVIKQDLPQLLNSIVERAVGLLKASSGGLYLCDPVQRQVRCVVSYNTLRDYTGNVLKYGEGAAGLVAETGEPLIIVDYRIWEGRAALYEQDQPFISLLSVPIRWQDRVIGILHVLENIKPRTFTQEELQVLTLFANQAAIAVENSRLFEFEQRRHQETAAIVEVGRDISASLQLDVVLERIASHAKELLSGETSAVYLVEQPKPILRAIAAIGPDTEEIKQDPLTIGEGILGNIAVRKTGEIVNNSTADERGITIKGTIDLPYEHLMGVPVLSRDQLTGLIAVWRQGIGREFNSADLDFLTSLAQQAAIAIENANLFEREKNRRLEAETLRDAAQKITATLDQAQAIQLILDQLYKVVPYESASVQLLREGYLEVIGGQGWPDPSAVLGSQFPIPGENPNTVVVLERCPLILGNAPEEYSLFNGPPHNYIQSWLGVPLVVRDRVIGMFAVDHSQPDFFRDTDAQLVNAFAGQAAIAIENACLYAEVQSLAIIDELTGLNNRRGLFKLGQQEMERAARFKYQLAVLFLDIDRFKLINDTYSYSVGDQALRQLAKCLRANLREFDLAGRYGGEEFVVLLPEVNLQTANEVAERVRHSVEMMRIQTDKGDTNITVSIGVCQKTESLPDLDALIYYAGQALHLAKEAGRNRVAVI
jgi:diguanylate cyclase (GGDEF)-like protein/PAS domain S-box-containing protein